MILNDNSNIEHRKQDYTLNSSGLEFQGEEEEVQEHIHPPAVCQDILKQAAAEAANLTVVPAPPTIHHHSPPTPMITPSNIHRHRHLYALCCKDGVNCREFD